MKVFQWLGFFGRFRRARFLGCRFSLGNAGAFGHLDGMLFVASDQSGFFHGVPRPCQREVAGLGEPDVDGAGLSAGLADGAKSLAGAGWAGAVTVAFVLCVALEGPMPKASG